MKTYILEDDEEYVAVEEIPNNEVTYLYLANLKDEKDICVRKEIKDEILPLDSEEEFNKAMLLFSQKNKDLMKDLLDK